MFGGKKWYKMRLNILKKAIIIGLCCIAAIVVAFVMKSSPEPVQAIESDELMPWQSNLVSEINIIRDKYGLSHLEWSFSCNDSEKILSTIHNGSIYSDDELFTGYLVSYWFNSDNSIFLNENTKYVYVNIELQDEVLTASLYFPSENKALEDNAQVSYYSKGNTEHYDMEAVIASKRPTVQAPEGTVSSPVFLNTNIQIPIYQLDNIYDFSKYIQASDVGKIILIQTDFYRVQEIVSPETEAPMETEVPAETEAPTETELPDETEAPTETNNYIYAVAVNNYGVASTEKITVSYEELQYYNANTSTPGDYCMTINPSGEVEQYGHVILQCRPIEKTAKYVFEIISPNGTEKKIIRHSNGMIWNPNECGTYSVCMYSIINNNGVETRSESIEFTLEVNEFINVEIKIPSLTFTEGTGFIKNDELGTIYGVEPGTTVGTLINAAVLVDADENIILYVENKTETDNLGTGTQITVQSSDGKNIYHTYTILCYGDINGDGLVGIADFAKLRAYILGKIELEGALRTCADVNFDGTIGIADFAKLRAALLNKIIIEQTKQASIDEV